MEEKKERILTIAIHKTYDVPIVCDDAILPLIQDYPKGFQYLPIDILERIEKAEKHGQCVDEYAEVVEIDTVEF